MIILMIQRSHCAMFDYLLSRFELIIEVRLASMKEFPRCRSCYTKSTKGFIAGNGVQDEELMPSECLSVDGNESLPRLYLLGYF